MAAGFPTHLFEEHSATLPVWWAQPERPRTVVYLDAHLDLQQLDAAKIDALRRCETIEAVRALEAPHHLESSSRYAFGIENFLYPAHQLGLIEHLIWVAPPHVPTTYSPALLEYVQQMDGISFEELTGFAAEGSALHGRLLGLNITICGLGDLGELEIAPGYCLDIDIDFFVTVPGDTLWTDPGAAVRGLLETAGPPRLATVSRAVSSGFTPLHLRFVGDYVAAALSGDGGAVRHYQRLHDAIAAMEMGDPGRAESICRGAMDARPDCASSAFLLARALGDSNEARDARNRAVELDAGYGPDLSRDASAFPNRGRPLDGRQLRTLLDRLDEQVAGTGRRMYAEAALAMLCARAGLPGEAWRLLKPAFDASSENSDALLALAGAMLSGAAPHEAIPLLQRARRHDSTRTSALLHLGDLALRAGTVEQADSYYREVADRAPAWTLPLERLRLCRETLGDRAGVAELHRIIEQRKSVLAGLVTG